jgi:hypothetical protein
MMDNASALPTPAQQQQQQKLLLIIVDQKLPTRLRDEAFLLTTGIQRAGDFPLHLVGAFD